MVSPTFETSGDADHINLGIGQPSADLLPLTLLAQASQSFFETGQPQDLNYGPIQGDQGFRISLAEFLAKQFEQTVDPDSLTVSAGNSQALDLICGRLLERNDIVFVEEPSYFLAFKIFRDHGAQLVSIPVDDHGMSIEFLESALEQLRPKLVYTIPCFHNPGGQTLIEERRRRLLALAQEYEFYVVADEPYHFLSYTQEPPPAFGTRIDDGPVFSLGSFSKILAPGLRLGWIQANQKLTGKLLRSGVLNSGGSLNHFTSLVVKQALDHGSADKHLSLVKHQLSQRVAAMGHALRTHLSDLASWRVPHGGYFFWLQLAGGIDAQELKDRAKELGTGFQPGSVFSANRGLENYIRLSFAHYDETQIETAIIRLRQVLRD